MSWLFSRALVEAYSAANSSDGEPFVPLSGNPTPQAYCAPDKMTEFSRLSRFGITFKPLTESRGEELLTWYLAGFPVKTSVPRGGGAGISGSRSGLWSEMARIIGEVQPRYAFVENSPMLTSRGLGTVLGDLAALGFDARWGVISAADVGAPHLRERIWIVAHNNSDSQSIDAEPICESNIPNTVSNRRNREIGGKGGNGWFGFHGKNEQMADTDSAQRKGNECTKRSIEERTNFSKPSWWEFEPDVGRVANWVAARVDRLKAIGNGQVPAVAATAWRLLN